MKLSIGMVSKIGIVVVLMAALSIMMVGCGEKESADADKGTVNLVYVNWAEGIAMTNLVKAVLEEKMGYTVNTQVADVGPVYTSVAQGSNDAFLDGWLPVTHGSYMEEYGDKIVDLGTNYDGARIGVVVPSYVTINSITEMNDNADKFDGKIIGIDAGAGIMKATERAIDTYGLNLELVSSSGPAMTAALKNAIDKNEWVAVTGWKPHWKFARWDLKFLEDPEAEYGAVENIHCIVRQGLAQDMPEVTEFLKAFHMTDATLGDLMGKIADAEKADPSEVAKTWMNNHPDVVAEWLPK
ncbi:glycine/betaine ABC transporter [candidate division GN15 bacterium]|nr:glycine/betaine ABC transporter [candidate division GN15 bacterium]